jgi:hypothetical protein
LFSAPAPDPLKKGESRDDFEIRLQLTSPQHLLFEQMLSIYIYAIPANGLRNRSKIQQGWEIRGKPLDFESKSPYNELIYATSQKEGWVLVAAGGAPPAATNTFPSNY